MPAAWPVVVFGELLFDVFPDAEVLGGAPANLAFRLTELGWPALLVSRVGVDPRGEAALEVLLRLGIEASGIEKDATHQTGTVPITFRADGTHDFTILRDVAYDHIEARAVAVRAANRQARCLAFGTLVQRSEVSRRALESLLDETSAQCRVCDVNLRRDCFSNESLRFSLERCTVLKLNADELPVLAALRPGLPLEPAAFCQAAVDCFGLDTVVVTRGADGAVAFNARGEGAEVAGHRVQVVDTIGSGDAFTAAFVASLLEGRSLSDACARGNALGALVAATRGGTTPISSHRIEGMLDPPVLG